MSLQGSVVGHEINNVDLTQIAGLQQKRTLAFVNHFLVTTVQFLNKFTKDCEEKLMNFERKLEKVNASMVLLESKLSSIPEVSGPLQSRTENPEPSNETNAGNQDSKTVVTSQSNVINPAQLEGSNAATAPNMPNNQETATVSPEYMRFVKMVQVGVPLQAVKLKLMMEGLDASLFDTIYNSHQIDKK